MCTRRGTREGFTLPSGESSGPIPLATVARRSRSYLDNRNFAIQHASHPAARHRCNTLKEKEREAKKKENSALHLVLRRIQRALRVQNCRVAFAIREIKYKITFFFSILTYNLSLNICNSVRKHFSIS